MEDYFGRRAAAFKNELSQSMGALIGICTGMLSDKQLSDDEIHFLESWLSSHSAIATTWPGNVIFSRVKTVLEDGVITDAERDHLLQTLQQLIGGTLEDLASSPQIAVLALDKIDSVVFPGSTFCFTGDFVFSTRAVCGDETERRGGIVKSSVSKKLHYLVVGGLGSPEWKHGSFGTKIEAAMRWKAEGATLQLVHEDVWARSL